MFGYKRLWGYSGGTGTVLGVYWTFNVTLYSQYGATPFGYIRQSIAFDSGGAEVAANTPVYEVI